MFLKNVSFEKILWAVHTYGLARGAILEVRGVGKFVKIFSCMGAPLLSGDRG